MVVVDSHSHIGKCAVFLLDVKEKELIQAMDEAGIDKTVIQPFGAPPDPVKEHDKIAKLAKKYPGRIYGMASMNPLKYGVDATVAEIERAVKDLKFRAAKIHTIAWSLLPFNPPAEEIIKKSQKLGVPVMVHTGGSLLSYPSQVEVVAKKYPDVTFILGHMGWVWNAADAVLTASRCSNIMLETSWAAYYDIKWAVDTVGAERILLGSDLPPNAKVEVVKIKSMKLPAKQERLILGENAARVFKIPTKS